MPDADTPRAHATARLAVGTLLILLYVLPLFTPPAAQVVTPPTAATDLMGRLFPGVPAWWVLARLLALLIGATLVASSSSGEAIDLEASDSAPRSWQWNQAWIPRAALLAAVAQLCSLPFLDQFSSAAQTLFMLWTIVPGCLLLCSLVPSPHQAASTRPHVDSMALLVLIVVITWSASRLWMSWHSPRAADIVDMWRTFGGLVRLAGSHANFLIDSMGNNSGATADRELQGVNAIQLFFQGLPLLQLWSRVPDLLWMQAWNTLWLAAAAIAVAATAKDLVGRTAMPVAAAGFLFSPFLLLYQLSPLPMVAVFLSALLGLLLIRFWRFDSPVVLALFGSVAGLTATMPTLVPMTGIALLLVFWRLHRSSRVPRLVIATAGLSFLAVLATGIPSPDTVGSMVNTYALTHWPWVIGERALQGQISPTIGDWTTSDPPPWFLIPLGTLLSPFALARNSHRLWGDSLYEPLSAAFAAIGLLLCLRRAGRDRPSLVLLLFLLASLLTGFISSYDRPAPNRVHGALIPLALLAAVGFQTVIAAVKHPRVRHSLAAITAGIIALSGTVLFDVINPPLLSASAVGLMVRALAGAHAPTAAMLTARGEALNPIYVKDINKHWLADWLHHDHPYMEQILRCVPPQPIPLLPIDRAEALRPFELLFWSPAIDVTAKASSEICRLWPQSALYTIYDQAHLSHVLAARPQGLGWKPPLPKEQWTVRRCEVSH